MSRSDRRSGSSPNGANEFGGGVRSYLPKIPKTPSYFSLGGWAVVRNGGAGFLEKVGRLGWWSGKRGVCPPQ